MHCGYAGAMPASNRNPSLIGWRLLALLYDLFPVIALWLLASAAFTLAYWLAGHPLRQNIAPFSPLQWLLWLVCWLLTGAYAVVSWHRGGRTLGMRPWRLTVVRTDGGVAPVHALVRRYAVGTLSVLLAGAGFWWAWVDRDGLTWHDRWSDTRMVRMTKPAGG
jgi:uncharacterized RDD family membrane protein YckC